MDGSSPDTVVNTALLESDLHAADDGICRMEIKKKIELASSDLDWSGKYGHDLADDLRSFNEYTADYYDDIAIHEISTQINTRKIITMPDFMGEDSESSKKYEELMDMSFKKSDKKNSNWFDKPSSDDGTTAHRELADEVDRIDHHVDKIDDNMKLFDRRSKPIGVNVDKIAKEISDIVYEIIPVSLSMKNYEKLRKELCKFLEDCVPQIWAINRLTKFIEITSSSKESLRKKYQNYEKFPGKKVRNGMKVVTNDPARFLERVWREEIDRDCIHTGILCTLDEPLYRALDADRRKYNKKWSEFEILTKEESIIAQMDAIYQLFGGQFSMKIIKRFFNAVAKSSYGNLAAV